ncbi:MAG: cupin domain-containing protein [Alphaproteobacteria bacterium]
MMGQVWQAADRAAEGIIEDTNFIELGVAPACLAPGQTVSEHSHTLVEEINIFKSGKGQIQIENDFFDVCAGSVSVVPAGEFHAITNTGTENLEFVTVFNKNVVADDIDFKNREQHFGLNELSGYLSILNKIAAGEAGGAKAFRCWSEKTGNPALAEVLTKIAIREAEHSAAFEKRLCELGHAVDFNDVDDTSCDLFACLESDASDLEKLERFAEQPGQKDPFRGIFNDPEIDPETGALLGRFIAEERDSVRMLRACHAEICGKEASAATSASGVTLDQVCEAVTSLTGLVGELKDEIAALKANKTKPAPRRKSTKARKTA